MTRESTSVKARRLFDSGAVVRVDEERPRLFAVRSGANTYRVVVGRHLGWCSCPAGERSVECSHLEAARLTLEAEA